MKEINAQSPISVANFIIELANKHNLPVTNLQLQKILFFVQGFSLAEYQSSLINGKFSKWQYGPVQQDVYHAFRDNGSSFIESTALDIGWDENGKIIINHSSSIDAEKIGNTQAFNEIKKFILNILHVKVWTLVQMTHSEVSWKGPKQEIMNHSAGDYTDEEIKQCYLDNEYEISKNY